MASVINDILTIQDSHIVGVREDANNAHRRDKLKVVLQDGLYLSNSLIVEERVKAFVNKLFDQAAAIY